MATPAMPIVMKLNCEHSPDGWCGACVAKLQPLIEATRTLVDQQQITTMHLLKHLVCNMSFPHVPELDTRENQVARMVEFGKMRDRYNSLVHAYSTAIGIVNFLKAAELPSVVNLPGVK